MNINVVMIKLRTQVTKLTARCELCGKRGFFTLRKTEETRTELTAGADVYMLVCRQLYANGQEVIQSSKNVLGSRAIRTGSNLEALLSLI
ncbi:Thymidine kinase, partial [Cucurbita argyrosperma subsp. sororia]